MRWYKRLQLWWRNLRKPLSLGQRGEREAARFLKRRGMLIVARGDRAKLGEIDLVAVDQRTVVFVEVKTRTTHEAGHPAEIAHEDVERFAEIHMVEPCRASAKTRLAVPVERRAFVGRALISVVPTVEVCQPGSVS